MPMLLGYETVLSNKKFAVYDLQGPASYVNPGGQAFNASQIGWGGFDVVNPLFQAVTGTTQYTGRSLSGTYFVTVVLNPAITGNASPGVTVTWYVVATGAQVANATDLSAQYVRLELVGV